MTDQTIKETKELLEGLKEAFKLGKNIRDIVADGLSAEDLTEAFTVIKEQYENIDLYDAAITDIDKIKDEVKDLSKDEMVELFLLIVTSISEVEKE